MAPVPTHSHRYTSWQSTSLTGRPPAPPKIRFVLLHWQNYLHWKRLQNEWDKTRARFVAGFLRLPCALSLPTSPADGARPEGTGALPPCRGGGGGAGLRGDGQCSPQLPSYFAVPAWALSPSSREFGWNPARDWNLWSLFCSRYPNKMMEFQHGLEKMPLNAIFTVLSVKISHLEHSWLGVCLWDSPQRAGLSLAVPLLQREFALCSRRTGSSAT